VPTHLALGSGAGLTDEELSWLAEWPQASCFDETDRLVLRYADSLTRDVAVPDDLWTALAARFSQQEIFELCFSVGTANLVNRVHATFLTDVDAGTSARVAQLGADVDLPEPRH
jgi:alkylhydroperoxidase family enzyme